MGIKALTADTITLTISDAAYRAIKSGKLYVEYRADTPSNRALFARPLPGFILAPDRPTKPIIRVLDIRLIKKPAHLVHELPGSKIWAVWLGRVRSRASKVL